MSSRGRRSAPAASRRSGVGRDGAQPVILGTAPNYGPGAVTPVPNLAAAGPLLWVPGLDDWWNPQGLTFAAGNLLISAYRSERFGVNRGPCRVFRVDPASGRETGHFDVPPPCGHAGGLAYGGKGKLYIADTHTLFEVDLARAFVEPAPPFRSFPLGPGLKGASPRSGPEAIWLGTYEEDRPGRIFKFERDVLEALPDRAVLGGELASAACRSRATRREPQWVPASSGCRAASSAGALSKGSTSPAAASRSAIRSPAASKGSPSTKPGGYGPFPKPEPAISHCAIRSSRWSSGRCHANDSRWQQSVDGD